MGGWRKDGVNFRKMERNEGIKKRKRGQNKERQRRYNCETERERKQEERSEGALKPHFPVDLLVRQH